MYCRHCGSQISEQAVVCPHCGCATGKQVIRRPAKMHRPIAGFVISLFAVPMMILGLTGLVGVAAFICSCIEYTKAKKANGQTEFALAGMVLGGVVCLLFLIAIGNTFIDSTWIATHGLL